MYSVMVKHRAVCCTSGDMTPSTQNMSALQLLSGATIRKQLLFYTGLELLDLHLVALIVFKIVYAAL